MSRIQTRTTSIMLWVALVGFAGIVHAEGVVQNAGKDMVKGAVKGVQQEINAAEVTKGAKQVTKGVLDGVADEVPLMTSQMVNQANVNKKAMGKVARQVSSQAVAGALDVTMSEMNEALGAKGDGPLANSLVAMTERLTAAIVRGASSEVHISYPPVWPIALAFVVGGLSTLACGVGLMLLYLLFQRRRAPIAEPVVVAPAPPAVRPRPAMNVG